MARGTARASDRAAKGPTSSEAARPCRSTFLRWAHGECCRRRNITFRNLTLHSLPRGSGQNGCRIKTDPGVKHAHIWDVTYQDIKMDGVGYTIEVTQNYGGKPGGKNSAASVHSQFLIEDVRFRKRTTNKFRAAFDCL